MGWNRENVGRVVRALGDGLFIGEHFDGEKRMNIILRGEDFAARAAAAIARSSGCPLSSPSGRLFTSSFLSS